MQIAISDIIVKKRIREDLGDIATLTTSIEKHGLIHPLVVNKKNELISGYRRYCALKQLNYQVVDVIILETMDHKDLLEIEIDENILRKDFTVEEVEKYRKRLERANRKNPFVTFWNWLKSLFAKKEKRD